MTSRILLTGGSGDLGLLLSRSLAGRGDEPVNLDIRPPRKAFGSFVQGSILDRALLNETMAGIDLVVHIAAWHGVHDIRAEKDAYDFWELNVTGTFEVFEAAARSGIERVLFISSTSVDEPYGLYGHTKILGEEIAQAYAQRHSMHVMTLRPRAFIPYWNQAVYKNYIEWAEWFWDGAVHITDEEQATRKAIDCLLADPPEKLHTLVIDGAYEYTQVDLENWDADGPGTTFAKYFPEYINLVLEHGLDPARKPDILGNEEAKEVVGYVPTYSIKNVLVDLLRFGEFGPPVEW